MGYIDSEDDGPAMCFNGVKSWYTFWYRDKMRSVSSSDTTNSFSGDIYGIANYDTSPGRVIVRIEDPFTSQNDHFVMFNRKTGINSGVVEAGDQVTVTRGDSFIESDLRAKLSKIVLINLCCQFVENGLLLTNSLELANALNT